MNKINWKILLIKVVNKSCEHKMSTKVVNIRWEQKLWTKVCKSCEQKRWTKVVNERYCASELSLTIISYLTVCCSKNKLSWAVGVGVSGSAGGILNNAQLSLARDGAGAWPELGKTIWTYLNYPNKMIILSCFEYFSGDNLTWNTPARIE